jgi:hypothetical protein
MKIYNYALLIGHAAAFQLPIIEAPSFSRLAESVRKDLEVLVDTGELPWYWPKSQEEGDTSGLSGWPSFGQVTQSEEWIALNLLRYPRGSDQIDLHGSYGQFLCGWRGGLRGSWCFVDHTQGGGINSSASPLPNAAEIEADVRMFLRAALFGSPSARNKLRRRVYAKAYDSGEWELSPYKAIDWSSFNETAPKTST